MHGTPLQPIAVYDKSQVGRRCVVKSEMRDGPQATPWWGLAAKMKCASLNVQREVLLTVVRRPSTADQLRRSRLKAEEIKKEIRCAIMGL